MHKLKHIINFYMQYDTLKICVYIFPRSGIVGNFNFLLFFFIFLKLFYYNHRIALKTVKYLSWSEKLFFDFFSLPVWFIYTSLLLPSLFILKKKLLSSFFLAIQVLPSTPLWKFSLFYSGSTLICRCVSPVMEHRWQRLKTVTSHSLMFEPWFWLLSTVWTHTK